MPVDQKWHHYPDSITPHKYEPEILDLQVTVERRPRPVLDIRIHADCKLYGETSTGRQHSFKIM